MTRNPRRTAVGDPKPTAAGHWKKSIRAARLYADQCGREYVKRLYDCCVTCGSRDSLEWAHVLSGKGDAVKWEPLNMTRQCTRCNQLHESHPEHLIQWFVNNYGAQEYVNLTVTANRTVKYRYADIMDKGDILRNLCASKGLERENSC